jgi:hypothetical protein
MKLGLFTRAAILAGALSVASTVNAQQQVFTLAPMQPVVTASPVPQSSSRTVVYYDNSARYYQSDWQRKQEERYRRDRDLDRISGTLRWLADGVQIFRGGNGYYSGNGYYGYQSYGLTGGYPLTTGSNYYYPTNGYGYRF